MTSELENKIKIKNDGTIFLGKNVVCDGVDYGIRNAVFTQIHSDRLSLFPAALQNCNNVIVSDLSAELLISDKINFGDFLTIKENFKSLPFKKTFLDENSKITLFDSSHILGSSHVLVEENNLRMLYSSEFRLPSCSPILTDILVLDSIHGIPDFKNDDDESETLNQLVELIREKIELGISIILQAKRGQLQELMSFLSSELPEPTPFVAPFLSCNFAQVYRNHGYEIRHLFTNSTEECEELFSSDISVVQFVSDDPIIRLRVLEELEGMDFYKIEIGGDITTSGGILNYDVVNNSAKFNIPIHASFEDTLKYVKKCEPKLVITENTRRSYGKRLAEEIQNRLEIPSKYYPIK